MNAISEKKNLVWGLIKRHKFISNLSKVNTQKNFLLKSQAYVNGEWVDAEKRVKFPVMNPADDKVIIKIPNMDATDCKYAIDCAYQAFHTWKETTAKERSIILRNWFDLCQKHEEELSVIITTESGKTLDESKSEIAYGNSYLDFFACAARCHYGEIIPSPWRNKEIHLTRQPIGVVSIITPWNFPFGMVVRKVGALLAAGCTCVIKPSEDTPLTALAAAALGEQAGVPKGVINVVTCSREFVPPVGVVLCQHPAVRIISLTGSTSIGKILYKLAASGIKKLSLELGGNAPFIVFPSADIEIAADKAMIAKFRNSGQACIGANRFYIHENVFDKFVNAFKNRIVSQLKIGPGIKKGVNLGPLVNQMQTNKVCKLVNDAVSKGAKLIHGGKTRPDLGSKNFYEPTLLTGVSPKAQIFTEEIFGPVAVCYKFKTEEEVLKAANSTTSGLASYVFTSDLGEAFRMSKNLEFGMVAINEGMLSCAETAFGGIKESGIGREGSMHGLHEYTEIKYTLVAGLDKQKC